MFNKFAAAALTALLLACVQTTMAADKLFKDFEYGSPMAQYTVAAGYYDCTEDIGAPAKCLDDVDFMGEKFTVALLFSKSQLSTVSLISPFNENSYAKVITGINKSFTMVSLSDGKSVLDIIELYAKEKNRETTIAKVTHYEAIAMGAGNITYNFLEGEYRKKGELNAVSLLGALPATTRSAAIIIASDEDGANMIVQFGFPRHDTNKIIEASKAPVEAF